MLFELSTGLRAYLLVLVFVLGACMGSFLNCAAWRYVHHESVWKGRSHCPACHAVLSVPDLIPVFSWLVLRGRCRHCKAPVSPRYLAVEVLLGLLYVAVVVREDLTIRALFTLLLFTILLPAALIDWESMILPDGLTAAGAVLYLLSLPAAPDPLTELRDGVLGTVVIGGGVLALTLLMEHLLGREAMGGGDIKLLGMLGLWVHTDGGLLLLIVACLVGLVLAKLLSARNRLFPFGPAIIGAACIVRLFGEELIARYLSLFV